MNPNSAKNWTLDSYATDTWTDLVDEESIVACISICNSTAGAVNVSLRLSDGSSNNLARIIPTNELAAYDAFVVDLRSIAVTGVQTIQVTCSAPGVEFLASGAVEEV